MAGQDPKETLRALIKKNKGIRDGIQKDIEKWIEGDLVMDEGSEWQDAPSKKRPTKVRPLFLKDSASFPLLCGCGFFVS